MLKLFKKQEVKPLRFYSSCDDLPIWNFHKIMEESNYSYLVMNWDGFEKMEIDQEKAIHVWSEIYNEYCKLTSNNKSILYYKNRQRLLYMETRIVVCGKMLVQMAIRNMRDEMFLEYIKVLRSYDVP